MPRKKSNRHVGSSFEHFLIEEGRLQESTARAVKRVLAWEIERAMQEARLSQAELARRMKTSRAVVHRLLDPDDTSVTLATLTRVAIALGRTVRFKFAA
jgi:ribosome-binding protein aMBF1 (putative translation factor)